MAEFEKLAGEYVDSDKEREQLGLDPNEYAIYTTLKTNIKCFMHAYIPDWEELETKLQTYAKKEDKKKDAPHIKSKSKKG